MPEQRLKQFDHLLRALGSGCPPHAGIALGHTFLNVLFTDIQDWIG
jgi:aspartyl-tRNA synthetase